MIALQKLSRGNGSYFYDFMCWQASGSRMKSGEKTSLRMEVYMNLEIANRLVGLRKENKLSQEALAEKLGISRQAVSKWERAEASPDTDNLIALAKLYHISLDELLKIHEEESDCVEEWERTAVMVVPDGETTSDEGEKEGTFCAETEDCAREENRQREEEDVRLGFNGIHVRDKEGQEVHISWKGIHVYDNEKEVHIDKNGIIVNGEPVYGHLLGQGRKEEFPLGVLAIVIYIVMGACFNLWHPGWILFFLVPVISSLIHAVRCRNANLFAYPCLVLFLYLYMGFVHFLWHPAWVLFLTVPLYYSLMEYFFRNWTADREDR